MALQEIAFESLSMAREAVRGTLITPPTHRLNLKGLITPKQTLYRPPDALGTLEDYYRSEVMRQWGELKADGDIDIQKMPFVLQGVVRGGTVTPTTPTNGVLTRLFTYTPNIIADDLDSYTAYWGDNIGALLWQSKYTMMDTMTINSDASGTSAVGIGLTGTGQFPTHLGSNPALPAATAGNLLVPGRGQLWLDTSSAIGTTPITGRHISSTISVPTGVTYKYVSNGPTGTVTFDHTGRKKRHVELKLKFELADSAQYDLFAAHTTCKIRYRMNGALIESVTPDYYNFLEFDVYGPMTNPSWTDLENTNRAVEFTVMSEVDSTAGVSWLARVQKSGATI